MAIVSFGTFRILAELTFVAFMAATPSQGGEIHKAATQFPGALRAVKLLLDADPGLLNTMDDNGNNTLHIAVARGDDDLVKFLLQKGANVNARNAKGETPLVVAAHLSQTRISFSAGPGLTGTITGAETHGD